jgi:hypothetical protein
MTTTMEARHLGRPGRRRPAQCGTCERRPAVCAVKAKTPGGGERIMALCVADAAKLGAEDLLVPWYGWEVHRGAR